MLNKTIVFIDSRVADHPTLIAGLSAECEPVWLDATQDGLAQMEAALADRRDLASIRILALRSRQGERRPRLRARAGESLRCRGLGFFKAGRPCRFGG
jgi:hypothetical protein